MDFHDASGWGTTKSLADPLRTINDNQNGQNPAANTAELERSITGIWQRIQAQPDTYVMTMDEFAIFKYYQDHFEDEVTAQQAVIRFRDFANRGSWKPTQFTSSLLSDPDIIGTFPGEGKYSKENAAYASSFSPSALSKFPPQGLSSVEQRSCTWQDRLREHCQTSLLPEPVYNIVSHRRGGRTALSCTVSASGHIFAARYWYDRNYINTAKEDVSEVALHMLAATIKETYDSEHLNLADEVSGSDSEDKGSFQPERQDPRKIFFDPENGGIKYLTPATTVCSDDEDSAWDPPLKGSIEGSAQILSAADGSMGTGATVEGKDETIIGSSAAISGKGLCAATGYSSGDTNFTLPKTISKSDLVVMLEENHEDTATEATDEAPGSDWDDEGGPVWEIDALSVSDLSGLSISGKLDVMDLARPRVPSGFRRIKWNCRCGTGLYKDLEDLGRLETLLYRHSHLPKLMRTTYETPASGQPPRMLLAAQKSCGTDKVQQQSGTPLPIQNPRLRPPPLRKWLLLCIKRYHKTDFIEIDVTSCHTDKDLFGKLTTVYNIKRRIRPLIVHSTRPVSIEFVKFKRYGRLVDILERDSIPPATETSEGKYQCHSELVSLIGVTLLHYLEHPEHVMAERSTFLDCLPKRVSSGVIGEEIGWGLQVTEGHNFMFLILNILLSMAISLVWAIATEDVRAAFKIAIYTLIIQAAAQATLAAFYYKVGRVGHFLKNPLKLSVKLVGQLLIYLVSRLEILMVIGYQNLVMIFPHNYSKSIDVLNGVEYTITNVAKGYVEILTRESWDWWPLRPYFRPLQPNEVRVKWQCDTGHTHWSEIPKNNVHLLRKALKRQAISQAATSDPKKPLASTPKVLVGSGNASNTESSHVSGSQSSDGRSSPATSDDGSSDLPDGDRSPGDNQSLDKEVDPPGAGIALDIVPPSRLKGYVLFGVMGARRLRRARIPLAQIDVQVYKDDDSFFDELRVQYKNLRGHIHCILSIWNFHTCEFIMFQKANPDDIMAGPKEMPPLTDGDYDYVAGRIPPILESVFSGSFYGCDKACVKSQLDFMNLFHECKGRNHCGKCRVLQRLPKRLKEWNINRDEEKEEAWGLNTVFGISFYKVFLYHVSILVGPLISWGLWLKKWPTDWQNASVPFLAVVMLLSLFWLPITYNEECTAREKRLKDKIE